MVQHKLAFEIDPDVGDWILTLTVRGGESSFYTHHPKRVYKRGTLENNWLRRELAAADSVDWRGKGGVTAKHDTDADPNKVPDWAWEKYAPKEAKIAAFEQSGRLVFGTFETAEFKIYGGWLGIGLGNWLYKIHVPRKDHGITVPDWTKSLTPRPKGL